MCKPCLAHTSPSPRKLLACCTQQLTDFSVVFFVVVVVVVVCFKFEKSFLNIKNTNPCRENLRQLRMDSCILTTFHGLQNVLLGLETTGGKPHKLPESALKSIFIFSEKECA